MDRLQALVGTLSSLKTTSNNIIRNMVPIMSKIAEDDNDIIDEVNHRTEVEVEIISEYLQSMTLDIISDAEKVKAEIDAFASATEVGQNAIESNINSYPFLADVWFGDVYGKEGIEGMKILLNDLRHEESKTTEDWIIENAVGHFSVESTQ